MADRVRVAVLLSGRGSNMAALLYASRLPDCPYEIVLATSDKPDAAGLALAEAEGVPVARLPAYKPRDKADFYAALDQALQRAGVEQIALAGFMRILPADFIDRWTGRIVNIHPSLLPKYKGLDTHARAMEAGDAKVGCSVHEVTAELDDGPVLGQIEVAVLPDDTAETLAARVLVAEHQLYPATLARFVMRERTPEARLARLRSIAMELPGAEETVSHGMPCFRISGGKMFAYFTHDHHGDGIMAMIVKTSGPEEQAQLIEQDPDLYYRPAYFGPSGWVGMRLDGGDTDWEQVAARVEQSWVSIAPRKLLGMREF